MQTLYYVSASSSLALVPDNTDDFSNYWDNITSLITSTSLYQVVAFSGSEAVAYFPINNTNIYLDDFPAIVAYDPINQTTLGSVLYSINATIYSFQDTEYLLKQSGTDVVYVTGSLEYSNYGTFMLYSGSLEYRLRGTSSIFPQLDYSASVIIKDVTGSTLFTDSTYNTVASGSYTLGTGSATYQVTMSLNYYQPT